MAYTVEQGNVATMLWIRPCSLKLFLFIMAYNAVMRLIDKAFSQSENFHVGMKRLEAEITWKEDRQPRFIPFVDSQGHQGMRVIIEKKEDN